MARVKYNPGFLSDAALEEQFVVRDVDLAAIAETLANNLRAQNNQHLLVIGPRGSGKSMLVCRAGALVRADAELDAAWRVVRLGEELPTASSPGELWLEVLQRIADETGDDVLQKDVVLLRREMDETRLEGRAFARLMDIADATSRRLLLIVENLHTLFDDRQLGKDMGWVVRNRLQTEPRLMVLGTATARFDAMDNSDAPFFEMFRTLQLAPLDAEACRVLWAAVSGREISVEEARPLHILTGGSPRLVVTLAEYNADRPANHLLDGLLELLDDHTAYLKACLEDLPVQERKAFIALADLWKPSMASEVGERARIDSNAASVVLRRLVDRGAVEDAGTIGRVRLYQVAERLFNIYHLLRHRSGPDQRVRALLELMRAFYRPGAFAQAARSVVDASAETDDALYPALLRRMHAEARHYVWGRAAFEQLSGEKAGPTIAAILAASPPPEGDDSSMLVLRGLVWVFERLADPSVAADGPLDLSLSGWGVIGRFDELCRQLMRQDTGALPAQASVVIAVLERYSRQSVPLLEVCPALCSSTPKLWELLGFLHGLNGHLEDARRCFQHEVELAPEKPDGWRLLALVSGDLPRARAAYRRLLTFVEATETDWVDYLDTLAREEQLEPEDRVALASASGRGDDVGIIARCVLAAADLTANPEVMRVLATALPQGDHRSGSVELARWFVKNDMGSRGVPLDAYLAAAFAVEPDELSLGVIARMQNIAMNQIVRVQQAIGRLPLRSVLRFAMGVLDDPHSVARYGVAARERLLTSEDAKGRLIRVRLDVLLGHTTPVAQEIHRLASLSGDSLPPSLLGLLVDFVAAHAGTDVLAALASDRPVFAALCLAARKDAGERVLAPAEIAQVADDLLTQIRARRELITEIRRLQTEMAAAEATPKRARSPRRPPRSGPPAAKPAGRSAAEPV
ncbi:MAG: hypothetical protein IV100_01100 [Myxococcales bacterium]|nr:hypothetical protein [Myxococcales bacterium]